MVLKIYGATHSTCTRRVLTVLHEKNLEYKLVPINLARNEQASESFRAKQPFGKVPLLEDDGFRVYESRAICKYIARKYASRGNKLMPDEEDLKGYALFEQACAVETSYFDIPASGIAFERVFKPWKGLGDTDEFLVAKYAKALDATLEIYDAILSRQNYLAGDEVTLVDLFHLSLGKLLKEIGFPELFGRYPNVTRWLDEMSKRPSWIEVNPDGIGLPTNSSGACSMRPL